MTDDAIEQRARVLAPEAWATADDLRDIGKHGPWTGDLDEADYERLADNLVAASLQHAREAEPSPAHQPARNGIA